MSTRIQEIPAAPRARRRWAAIPAAGLGIGVLLTVSACGDGAVSKDSLAKEVATKLAAQENQPVPMVTCPKDLPGKVGATEDCVLTPQGSTQTLVVHVTVDKVDGSTVNFNIKVADSPTGGGASATPDAGSSSSSDTSSPAADSSSPTDDSASPTDDGSSPSDDGSSPTDDGSSPSDDGSGAGATDASPTS